MYKCVTPNHIIKHGGIYDMYGVCQIVCMYVLYCNTYGVCQILECLR